MYGHQAMITAQSMAADRPHVAPHRSAGLVAGIIAAVLATTLLLASLPSAAAVQGSDAAPSPTAAPAPGPRA